MELYALSHCPEQAQRWPEYDFSQVLIIGGRTVPVLPVGVASVHLTIIVRGILIRADPRQGPQESTFLWYPSPDSEDETT